MLSPRSGFLLVEACASIVLIGIFGFLLSTWYIQIIRAEEKIMHRVQAILLAHSCIEEFKALGAPPDIHINNGFTVTWQMTPDSTIPHFMHVTVTVSKVIEEQNITYTLHTGIRDAKRDKSC